MSCIDYIRKRYYPTLAEQLGYSDQDILVIVNIDDVGMHEDETEASFKALNFGIVKTGSIMVPGPNFNGVIELWKKAPQIDFGIHLTLTCEFGKKYPWTPILSQSEVPSLFNPEGIMWPGIIDLLEHATRKEVNLELEAQINKVLDAGLTPSHLDSHMDFHQHPNWFADIMRLSHEYNLPLRAWKRRRYRLPFVKNNLISLRRKGYVFPDTQKGIYMMGGQDQSYGFRKNRYYAHLRSLKPGVHNVKIHVSFQTKELNDIMGEHYSSIRQIDYDVWSSDETRKLAQELGITFIGYRPLQHLQEKLMGGCRG